MSLLSTQIEKRLANLQLETVLDEYEITAGLKKESSYEIINSQYQDLADPKYIVGLGLELKEVSDPREKENIDRLRNSLINHFVDSKTATIQNQLSELSIQEVVQYKNTEVGVLEIPSLIKRTHSFEEREYLYTLLSPLKKKYNTLASVLLQKQIPLMKEFYFSDNIISCYDQIKGYDHHSFLKTVGFLYNTIKPLYLNNVSKLCEMKLGVPFQNINRCHGWYLSHENRFDHLFTKDNVFPSIKSMLYTQGFDLDHLSGLLIDSEYRVGKDSRASCWPVNPPTDVRILTKTEGGFDDVTDLMHELGHGLHYSYTSPTLHYSEKLLGRNSALTEVFSYLFENLCLEPLWLMKAFQVDGDTAHHISEIYRLMNMILCVRYSGLFASEMSFYQQEDIYRSEIYANTMTSYTGFVYDAESYLYDQDDGFYSADYLKAWMNEATLSEYLKDTFGELWFENKKASEFLIELWKEGDRFSLEYIFDKIGIKADQIDALVHRYTQARYR